MRKAPHMSGRSSEHTCQQTHSLAIIDWQATKCSWSQAAMNMARLYWSMLNARALLRENSWHAITSRFAKFGIDWVYPGIYTLRRVPKITIESRKISFSRFTIKGTSSKILCCPLTAQRIAASCPTVTLKEPAHIAVTPWLVVINVTTVAAFSTPSTCFLLADASVES